MTVSGAAYTAEVDLSTATSFSDAADTLSTDLGLTVTFDLLHQAFIVTDEASGVASTITAATGTAATALGLDSGSGATVSQGADASTPGPFMSDIVTDQR